MNTEKHSRNVRSLFLLLAERKLFYNLFTLTGVLIRTESSEKKGLTREFCGERVESLLGNADYLRHVTSNRRI